MCNRVHLHIVLNSTCRSVGVLSCMDVIRSFTYVLRVVILDVTKRRGERAREKARGNTNGLWHVPSKEKNKIRNLWLWLVCCCLLPTCYFHRPFTYAPPTARHLSLSNVYLPGLFDFIFPKSSVHFFPALGVANAGFHVGPRNERRKVTRLPLDKIDCHRFPCWDPTECTHLELHTFTTCQTYQEAKLCR